MRKNTKWLCGVLTLWLGHAVYAQPTNLVVNGGFENPIATGRDASRITWDVFSSIPGWQLAFGPAFEIQRTKAGGWLPAEGSQWLELDADTIPPTHTTGSIGIYQDIATTPGVFYRLSFAFSPRPGHHPNNEPYDGVRVLWNGTVVATITEDGRALSNTNWTYYTFVVQATSSVSRLEFHDAGALNNTYGALLDDVRLEAVPEPASLSLLSAGVFSLLALRRRR